MTVQVRFVLAHDEPKKFAHPPTVSLSRVPVIGERVYALQYLDDVTWTVTDVVHHEFSVDNIDAVVTIRRS